MTTEHEGIKIAVSKLTDATNFLTLQLASLNQYRVSDHEMLQAHDRALNGAPQEPGLIEVTRNTEKSLTQLNSKIERVIWIIITPVIAGAVVMFIVFAGKYFAGKFP